MKKENYQKLIDFAEYAVNSQKVLEPAVALGVQFTAEWLVQQYAAQKGNRSLEQLSMYWAVWLPGIMSHFPESLGQPKSRQQLHNWFKFVFCHTKRDDLFDEVITRDPQTGEKKKMLVAFSAGLEKLAVKDMNEYMTFVQEWTENNIGDFNKVIEEEV